MTVSLDSNVVYLKDRLNISTGRMNSYADKSLDDIIKEEAKQGNTKATDYQREVFGSVDELIKSFKLDNPSNKLNVINSMTEEQKTQLLPLLSDEDMVMGLNFFTQDKVLAMFSQVPSSEAANVALETYSLDKVIAMIPDEQLEKFFYSDDVNKNQVVKQLQAMPSESLIQMVEGITGVESNTDDSMALIEQISSLPDKQYKETMANMDPNIQGQVVFQMANDNKKTLEIFDSSAYVGMMQRLQKPEMVKSMVALQTQSLQSMVTQLPGDLLSVVETQVNTEELAKFLMSNCQDVLSKLGNK